MKRLIKSVFVLIVLFSMVALMTGCTFPVAGKVTGGGWFEDQCGRKCTLGFNAHGDGDCCDGFEFKGQFQFNDHDDTKIHLTVMRLMEHVGLEGLLFYGEDDGEDVWVYVEDLGQSGPDKGDLIKIWCGGDSPHNPIGNPTYYGELGGGNIKIH